MKYILMFIKFVVNVILFCLYSLVAIVIGNFIFGAILKFLLDKPVPLSGDPAHEKVAIFMLVLTFIFTLILRKFFYFDMGTKKKEAVYQKTLTTNTSKGTVLKTEEIFDKETDEKFKIYVNKELK